MAAYVVRWTIEVEADTPEQAVEQAVELLPIAGSDSTATFFDVCPEEDADDPNVVWLSVDLRDWK